MVWWLVIAAVIAAALAYGYWDHTKQSRHLARLFAVLAAKHQGQVTAASLLAQVSINTSPVATSPSARAIT